MMSYTQYLDNDYIVVMLSFERGLYSKTSHVLRVVLPHNLSKLVRLTSL